MFGIRASESKVMEQAHDHFHGQNRFAVIPTAEKLKAVSGFCGRGVTIAFLDSGFYPHEDIAKRIVKFHDVSGEETELQSIKPNGHHWHGTQTAAVCAGDGSLSNGIYRGLASEADLVLVKVSEKGKISDRNIEQGLRWVLENRENYNIRVLNLSLGGDCDFLFSESKINQLAEELVSLGVVITVAAGNSAEMRSIPPANAPSVITIGGFSDENQFDNNGFELYHSNYGKTIDGLVKPEIIAPAMYVAAPILPQTVDYLKAETLSFIASSADYAFRKTYLENWEKAGLPEYILSTDLNTARRLVELELFQRKIIATHYQHVDGTSFAAPITASVVAQMLEANPNLTPAVIKNILISTASRLTNFPAIRQGFGVLNAGSAVEEALKEMHFFNHETLTPPRVEGEKVVFYYHDDKAETVHLAGDFNNWSSTDNQFTKNGDGLWHAEISNLTNGKYRYKFVIDQTNWKEDTSNGMKEEDGFGGFNSILQIS